MHVEFCMEIDYTHKYKFCMKQLPTWLLRGAFRIYVTNLTQLDCEVDLLEIIVM
jgi:hypothetical protein